MISIIKKPYPCSLSKNRMIFEVQTNRYFTSTAVYPSAYLVFADPLDLGFVYRLSFVDPESGNPVVIELNVVEGSTFNVANMGLLQGNTIPSSTFPETMEDVAEIAFIRLKSIPILTANYTITRNGDRIDLIAKEAIEELVLQFSSTQTFEGIFAVVYEPFNQPEYRDGYQMTATIYLERNFEQGDFVELLSQNVVIDDDAKGIIDVSNIIDSAILDTNEKTPFPELDEYIAPNLKRYQVVFTESWLGDINGSKTESEVLFVHFGGMSSDDDYFGNTISALAQTKSFLTWWPSGKIIQETDKDYLSWMNTGVAAQYDVICSVNHNQGNTSFTYKSFTLKTWQSGVFAVDVEIIKPQIPVGAVIANFSFQITSSAVEVSNSFSYFLNKNCLSKKALVFNAFGMPEIFYIDTFEESFQVNKQLANRGDFLSLGNRIPQQFVFDGFSSTQYSGKTGILTKQEAHRLTSVLNSEVCYLYELNKWIPVIIQPNETTVLLNSEFLYTIEFEMIRANETKKTSFFKNNLEFEVLLIGEKTFLKVTGIDVTITTRFAISMFSVNGTAIFTYNVGTGLYESIDHVFRNEETVFTGKVGTNQGTIPFKFAHHFKKKLIAFDVEDTNVAFSIYGINVNPGENINIDWGDGSTLEQLFANGNNAFSHTYADNSKRKIKIEKIQLNTIRYILSSDDLQNLEFDNLPNLEQVILNNQSSRAYYFSGISSLTSVQIQHSVIEYFEFGLQPKLSQLLIVNSNITSQMLDDIILGIWEYRKHYNALFPPSLVFTQLGFTPSSKFNEIKNGTGDYVGEGLVSDYNFNIIASA